MKIRGITVTGRSRQQAEDAYRAVATGKAVRGYADVNNEFMILCSGDADITPFNPLTGDADMVEASNDVVSKIEFQSEASDVVQQTNYVVCSSGCGAHVISDDIETRFCPACAEALPDDDCPDCDEQSQNQVHASAQIENITSRQILAAGKTVDEAVEAFRALAKAGSESCHVCGDIAVASNLPQGEFKFSPFLGDENIGVGEGLKMDAIASGDDDEQLDVHHFQCMNGDCELHVIASTDDTVFCPSCSSGLIEPEEEQTSTSGDDEDEEDLDDGEDDSDEDDSEDDSDDSDEDDSDDESDDDSNDDEDLEDGDDDDEESLSAATVRTKEPTVTVERPMLVCVAGTAPVADKLHVAYAGVVAGQKTAVAFYDGVPVATATAKTAEAYADMLDNPKFGQVLASAAGEIGVQPALAQMGFVDIKPQVEVSEMAQQQVTEQVTAQVAEIRATAAAEKKDLETRFAAALATAGQGINSGFFRDVTNPLLSALANTLTTIGVQDSEKMLRKVFDAHNDGYLKNLVAKASQIMHYDLNVQNELAEAVAGTVSVKETLPLGKPAVMAQPEQQQSQQPQQDVQQESVSSAGFGDKLNLALSSLGRTTGR